MSRGRQRTDRRAGRRPRTREPRGASHVGERHEAVIGPVAHGGHCVARVPVSPTSDPGATRVVFVRHALPGERVVLEVTEGTEGDRFWRADAVEILDPAPQRVTPPCPFAGPGRCGGCDFQHVALPHQRELKAAVVREQLARLAGLDVPVVVEPVPGDPGQPEGLRWRTRVQYATGPGGERGMRAHRSRRVVPVDDCRIARLDAREPAPGTVHEQVLGRDFAVAGDGFWQVHPAAPTVLVETVLELLGPRPGERALDLYAGVGLFTRFLAEAVAQKPADGPADAPADGPADGGAAGRVVAVEGDRTATEHARANLADLGHVEVLTGGVEQVLAAGAPEPVDLVVLDPPREGARRAVVEQVAARRPRAVAYVACDPAALARDLSYFAEAGYQLRALRAFDLFPMTHHVECVALLEQSGSDLRRSDSH